MYEVVWPRGKRTADSVSLVKRLDTLEGKTVCELWDWIFHGDQIFSSIEKELAKRYHDIKFVSYEAFGSIYGAQEGKALTTLPDKLKQYICDAVISGIGC